MAQSGQPRSTAEAKQEARERVWALLEQERAARFPGARGRIPNFAGPHDGETLLVTTVHPLQVVDGDLPEADHDFRVDRIVAGEEVIRYPQASRPPGLLWDHLEAPKIAAAPVLARMAGRDQP